jgi:hypothetical protein
VGYVYGVVGVGGGVGYGVRKAGSKGGVRSSGVVVCLGRNSRWSEVEWGRLDMSIREVKSSRGIFCSARLSLYYRPGLEITPIEKE